MKKVVVSIAALALAFAVFAPVASAEVTPVPETREPLACKPKGAKCHNSFECCDQNCQSVNGKETCH